MDRPVLNIRGLDSSVVLVTGGTGSIGREIVRRLMELDAGEIRVLSRSEHEQFILQEELGRPPTVRFIIGDVRDEHRLHRAVAGSRLVFHAAALKHVPVCELNPYEAVETNVTGTQNLIDACIDVGVEKVLAISTDKAANAQSVVGASKLLAEKLVTSATHNSGQHDTIFASIRLGNILGSRGSVLPIWLNQMSLRAQVTLTDPSMTRFVSSIREAVDDFIRAMDSSTGGEIFVPKMPAVSLSDLAAAVIQVYAPRFGIPPDSVMLQTIGRRPGEKLKEVLVTEEETAFACEDEHFYTILPLIDETELDTRAAARGGCRRAAPGVYDSSSARALSIAEIAGILGDHEDSQGLMGNALHDIEVSRA